MVALHVTTWTHSKHCSWVGSTLYQERNVKNSVAPKLLCAHGQGIVSPGLVGEGVTGQVC